MQSSTSHDAHHEPEHATSSQLHSPGPPPQVEQQRHGGEHVTAQHDTLEQGDPSSVPVNAQGAPAPTPARIPCETNLIGFFIKLCLWEPKWRKQGMREKWSSHRYRTRLGMQIDAAKIGEGACFTVTKRHEYAPEGTKAKLIVMKDTKLRFDRAGKPNDLTIFTAILNEVEILSHKPIFDHKNIVTLLDVRWDHPSMYKESLGPTLYLEYANMGTLTSYFQWYYPPENGSSDNNSNANTVLLVGRLLLDICRGLQALHACDITHGDVKPNNVLIFKGEQQDLTAKISDFGCSVLQRSVEDGCSNPGDSAWVELTGFTPPWDAPEAGTKIKAGLLHKTDIYSFGLLYWWARRGGNFPFELCDDATGHGDSRAQALEKLKQRKMEDLGPSMHQSLLDPGTASSSQSGKACLDEFEVNLVASATLTVDPNDRDLQVVAAALQQSIFSQSSDSAPHDSDHDEFSKISDVSWSPDKAWDVYLETAASWEITPKRFVDAMRVQVENTTSKLPRDDRQALNILLSRCYFEGFGVTQGDSETSAHYLRKAALAGSLTARGLTQAFHEILQVQIPPELPITDWLLAATKVNFLDASRKLAKLDYTLYRQAVPLPDHLDLHDPRFDTEEDFIAELLEWSPTRATNEVLGPSALSPVHFAAARGWTNALGLLLHPDNHYECRRFLNAGGMRGHTPLLMALVFRKPEAAVFLVAHGEEAVMSESALLALGSELPHPGGLFGMLFSLPLDETGDISHVAQLCQMFSATGGEPNWQRPEGLELDDLMGLEPSFREWIGHKLATAVELAVYCGDRSYLQSLLDAGAQPTPVALHLAAGLHDVDSFRLMFTHDNCPFKSLPELDSASPHPVLSTVLDQYGPCAIFSPLKRLFQSRKPNAEACRDMVQFITSIPGFSLYHVSSSPPPDQDPWWFSIMKKTYASHPMVLDVLLGPNHKLLNISNDPSKHRPPILWSSVMGNDRISLHLLSLGAEPIKDGPDNSLMDYLGFFCPDNEYLIQKLLEAGCDPNATRNKTSTGGWKLAETHEAQTPFQKAVLCQHFRSASRLYENGADRDYVTRALGCSKDLTILGHLLFITWSESQNRIRYLFEAYPNSPPPEFMVMPYAGLTALQIAAQMAPQNPHQEADAHDLMAYLVSRYPGTRFLEYQRFDNENDRHNAQVEGRGGYYPGSPVTTTTNTDKSNHDVNFAQTGMFYRHHQAKENNNNNNNNNLHVAVRDFKSHHTRVGNGTALLIAARECNLEAVKVLVEAGADVSAPLGQRKFNKWSGREMSSYATKELKYASNPLDFAVLARDDMDDDDGKYPMAMWEDTPETRAYYRKRIDLVIEYLVAKGGGRLSTGFAGERNTAMLWKTRKERGNRAALRFFGSTMQTAWDLGKEAFRSEFHGGMRQYREDREREEERQRQREMKMRREAEAEAEEEETTKTTMTEEEEEEE